MLISLTVGLSAQAPVKTQQSENIFSAKKAEMELFKRVTERDQGSVLAPTGDQTTTSSVALENSVALGSAGNLYTILRGTSNMVDANQDLNTVVFIHRNDPNALDADGNPFGQSTSQYRFDISTDGGATFENNVGPMSTIATHSAAGGDNDHARYPQISLINGGSVEDSHITYFGATHAGAAGGDFPWDGAVWGTAKLQDNTPFSITTGTNVMNDGTVVIPNSLVPGLENEFWANDVANDVSSAIDGPIIQYKGVFNGSSIDWEVNELIDNLYAIATDDASGDEFTVNTSITMGFSPDGMIGYMFSSADGFENPQGVYAPYWWMTTDGGATWEGPMSADMTYFDGFVPEDFGQVLDLNDEIVNVKPSLAFYQPDIVVDANGDAHVAVLLNARFYDVDEEVEVDYSIYGGPGVNEVVDLHYSVAEGRWSIKRFGDGLDASILVTSDTIITTGGPFTNTARTQVSRSPDATKIFFTWLDSTPEESAGSADGDNAYRDMKGVAYDINTGMCTPVKNFTTDNDELRGRAYYATVSPNSLQDGDTYKIPAVFTDVNNVGGADLESTPFIYFQGATFDESEFNVEVAVSNYAAPDVELVILVDGQPAEDGGAISVEGGSDLTAEDLITINQAGDVVIEGFDPAQLGEQDVTVTVTTPDGEETTVSYTITVEDSSDPTFELIGDDAYTVCQGEDFPVASDDVEALFTLTDNFIPAADDIADYITFDDSDVDVDEPGEYEVTYTATDANGNSSEQTITFVVLETAACVAPTVVVDYDGGTVDGSTITVEADAGADFVDGLTVDAGEGVDAEVSGDVDMGVPGDYEITVTATNDAGTTIETYTVTVEDTTNPTLTANESTVTSCSGTDPDAGNVDELLTAEDNADGVAVTPNSIDIDENTAPGSYPITYTATDAGGNTAEATITFEIQDSETTEECWTTGIQDLALANAISVTPNPTTGIFFLNIDAKYGKVAVQIVDIQGKQISTNNYEAANIRMDLSDVAAGVYFVKVSTDEATAIKKVIVE